MANTTTASMSANSPNAAVVSDAAPEDSNSMKEEESERPEEGSKEGGDENNDNSEEDDSDDDEVESSSSEEEEEENDADPSNNSEGLSAYERLRNEKVARNKARLRLLGLLKDNDNSSAAAAPKKKPPRKSLPKDFGPARHQPKRQVKGKPLAQEQLDLRSLGRKSIGGTSSSRTRCGECEGCTREEDCNKCIYCIDRINGKTTSRRCIFKACRKEKNPKNLGTEEQQDQTCNICQQAKDLVYCSECSEGFHSVCHFPKIKKLPDNDDEFICLDCNPRARLPNHFMAALMPNSTKLVKVKVLEPPPKCVLCEFEVDAIDEGIRCKACDNDFHLTCQSPPLEFKPKGGAARNWKCNACTEANKPLLEQYQYPAKRKSATPKTPKVKKPKNLKLFEGEHDDDCYICINGGELVCCDFCPKVFHPQCHIPALPAIPTGIWKCCECYASERNRKTRCGDCPACRAPDCGKCKFCLDKPKFGGPNKMKQTCVKRDCPYQSFAETYVEGKIPGEICPGPAVSSKKKKKRRRESNASVGKPSKKRVEQPAEVFMADSYDSPKVSDEITTKEREEQVVESKDESYQDIYAEQPWPEREEQVVESKDERYEYPGIYAEQPRPEREEQVVESKDERYEYPDVGAEKLPEQDDSYDYVKAAEASIDQNNEFWS